MNVQNPNIYNGLPAEFTDPLAFSRDRGETVGGETRELPASEA